MEKIFEKQNALGGRQKLLERKEYSMSFIDMPTPTVRGYRGDERTETAICVKDKYYILNGNHFNVYKKCKSLKECMAYFKKNEHLKSSWSN